MTDRRQDRPEEEPPGIPRDMPDQQAPSTGDPGDSVEGRGPEEHREDGAAEEPTD
ncbi:hypothetical protein [Streptomyces candidus]|uniref:Uncharacterized protein n=1 Tax=Streptomyces candidus TaxID=67283 RepID=A0A7X0HHY8_9ACTN|nr:hypothetical protein [Streptomyces candidus]MBB6437951.1 hypothetical protein [Streptomyces candidus]GHH49600.1 hypothetical protein GCM10018773_45230 [Streptomyces candidus]